MPVYAYKCRDCGTPLEVHQEFSDAPLTECPVCGGALRKQYGTIGVTFNGSGFYRTDSRAGDVRRPREVGVEERVQERVVRSGQDRSSTSKPASTPASNRVELLAPDRPPRPPDVTSRSWGGAARC